jgi:hypothetical protein
VRAFPVWRPNLDELDVDSAHALAFLILKSLKIIPLELSCMGPARVLRGLLSDGPETRNAIQRANRSCTSDKRCVYRRLEALCLVFARYCAISPFYQ